MTEKYELALAVLLWRNYRAVMTGDKGKTAWSKTIPAANDKAFILAKKFDVKKEYLELLFKFPVMNVSFKELEKWEKENLEDEEPTDFWKTIVLRKGSFGKSDWIFNKGSKKSNTQLKPKKSSKQSRSKSNKKSTTKSRR